MQARLDRPDCRPQLRRDLLLSQPEQIEATDGMPLSFRQQSDRISDPLGKLKGLHLLLWGRPHVDRISSRTFIQIEGAAATVRLTQPLTSDVEANGVEPRPKTVQISEPMKVQERRQCGFLPDVLCVIS